MGVRTSNPLLQQEHAVNVPSIEVSPTGTCNSLEPVLGDPLGLVELGWIPSGGSLCSARSPPPGGLHGLRSAGAADAEVRRRSRRIADGSWVL